MNKKLTLLFLLFSFISFSQSKTEQEFFRFNNDTLTFFLDKYGDIITKRYSKYFRKASFTPYQLNYEGELSDFYVDNNQLSYQTTYRNGKSNGNVKSFNIDGNIQYLGNYNNSINEGVWKFYYSNGNIEKIIEFDNSSPYLREFRNQKGKILVEDGTGKFKGNVIIGYKSITSYPIKGKIRNGKMDGWWYGLGGGELFENGVFKKGKTPALYYYDDPALNLTGFNLHEEATIFKFIAIPKKESPSNQAHKYLRYKGSRNLDIKFQPEFIDYITRINSENNIKNYKCFVQFVIDQDKTPENISVYSDYENISDSIKSYLSKLEYFTPTEQNNKITDCAVYFCFTVENGIVNIPKYSFLSSINVMPLIPNY